MTLRRFSRLINALQMRTAGTMGPSASVVRRMFRVQDCLRLRRVDLAEAD